MKSLPRSFDDIESCNLLFNRQGELAKIFCSSRNIDDDPYGSAMKRRYEELKAVINRRGFPKHRAIEFQDSLWTKADEWWMSLKTGRGAWSTVWGNGVMDVVLSVNALSNSSGCRFRS